MTTAYDELPDGVVVSDAGAVVTYANGQAARLLGLPVAQLVGSHVADAVALRDDEGREWWSCLRPYGGLATRTRLVEGSWFLPDGGEVLMTARLQRASRAGPVAAMIMMLRDAHPRQRMDRMRSDLVATVAHELRSPLTGIKGFTSALLDKWDRFSDAQRRFMLESVDADAERLARLISELLDVARIDSGRVQLRTVPLDLVKETAGLVRRFSPGDGRSLRLEASPVPPVWIDPDKYAQVLTNLLENTRHHGDGDVTVRVSPGTAYTVDVCVEDAGPGIPKDLRERVFGKFWRYGESAGTGLGLFIVRGLVKAHGGEVRIESRDGGGARVRVCLPEGTPDVLDES